MKRRNIEVAMQSRKHDDSEVNFQSAYVGRQWNLGRCTAFMSLSGLVSDFGVAECRDEAPDVTALLMLMYARRRASTYVGRRRRECNLRLNAIAASHQRSSGPSWACGDERAGVFFSRWWRCRWCSHVVAHKERADETRTTALHYRRLWQRKTRFRRLQWISLQRQRPHAWYTKDFIDQKFAFKASHV